VLLMHCNKYIFRRNYVDNLREVNRANQQLRRKNRELSSRHAANGVQVAYERSPKAGK